MFRRGGVLWPHGLLGPPDPVGLQRNYSHYQSHLPFSQLNTSCIKTSAAWPCGTALPSLIHISSLLATDCSFILFPILNYRVQHCGRLVDTGCHCISLGFFPPMVRFGSAKEDRTRINHAIDGSCWALDRSHASS